MIKPSQKKLWQFLKDNTKAYLFQHSCGSIYKLIPDLIEIGVDILNPIQVAAKDKDTKRLKEEFGDRLTFWGWQGGGLMHKEFSLTDLPRTLRWR